MLKANFLIPRATSIERKSKASRKEGTLLYLKSSLLLNSDSPWRKISPCETYKMINRKHQS